MHYYENKLKISRSHNYLNSNQPHYVFLQLENKKLKEDLEDMRKTAEDWHRAYNLAKPLAYEYTTWKADNFNSADVIITTDKTI
jgi:hypothetical protein